MINICMCGKQAGYGHEKNCPYPYYGNEDTLIIAWEKAKKEIDDIKKIVKENISLSLEFAIDDIYDYLQVPKWKINEIITDALNKKIIKQNNGKYKFVQ